MATTTSAASNADEAKFSDFGLDPRLIKVLERQNLVTPTLIQEKAIPLILEGKDILAKARTGSGKTLAYLLPILHRLLSTGERAASTLALVLVPTKELARQVHETISGLSQYFPKWIMCMNLASEESIQIQKSMLSSTPTIIISTPSRLLPHLDSESFKLSGLLYLVIDEADLVLSFGYGEDVQKLAHQYIPKTVQTMLMSATLNDDIDGLKGLVLRNPVTLKLEEAEEEGDASRLHQYVINCAADDKFLLMYVTLKLKLLKGKLLIFTNDVERSFKLALFLEQFGIKTCLLNPELPLASRHHIVDEFNRGVYDIIIASDVNEAATTAATKPSKTLGRKKKDKQSSSEGVSRGVDFKRVDVVINFDFPPRIDSYVHRIGRTARGGEEGTAISFIAGTEDKELYNLAVQDQEKKGNAIKVHDFDLKQLDGFRYRCNDALRAVTKMAIKNARLKAVKDELVKSEKLKSFFAERPKDLNLLRHDVAMNVLKPRPHLKHVPDYLFTVDTNDEQHDGGGGEKKAKLLHPLPQVERENVSSMATREKRPNKKNSGRKSKDPLKSIKKRIR